MEEEPLNLLPPMICSNPRNKILPELVPATDIVSKTENQVVRKYSQLVWAPPRKTLEPKPSHPLNISCFPDVMNFDIKNEVVVHKLWISNRSSRSIYIHCCGLWADTARLGAGWRCYPRTRFLLAPGLRGELFICAKPRNESPVPCVAAGLQLAASHLRDSVIGYFLVPIDVTFGNFKQTGLAEGDE